MQNKLEYEVPTYHNWSQVARFYHPLQAGSIDGTDTYPHDKGIWRALLAKYKPNKRVEGNPNCTLFVGRLNRETKEATLIKCFSKYGNIKSCRLVRDVVTGLSRGYAFIEYEHERDAKIAYREMYKTDIDGHEILVDYELERTLKGWIPRRLGGGLGGKKESGQLRFGGRDRPFRRPLPVKVLGQGHAGGSDHDKDYDRNRNRPSTCNRDSRDYQRDTRENREYHRDSRDYNRDTRESRDNHRDTRDSRDYHRDSRNYSRHSRDYNRDSRDSRDDSRDSRDRSGTRSFEREKDSYRDERPHEAGDGKDYDVDQKRRSDSSRDRRGSKHDWDRNEKDRRKEGRDQSHYDSYRKKGESSRKERK